MALFSKTTEELEEEKKAAPAGVGAFVPGKTATYHGVIIQPRVSEKSGKLASLGKYVFKVSPKTNKIEVKKAIEQSYKVKVVQVNIISMKGKNRTFGKTKGTTGIFKKAIVTLKAGDKIETAETV